MPAALKTSSAPAGGTGALIITGNARGGTLALRADGLPRARWLLWRMSCAAPRNLCAAVCPYVGARAAPGRAGGPAESTNASLSASTTATRSRWRSTQSPFADAGALAATQSALPAIRATTHVEGKAIRSSRRARRGAGCWLRTTIGASGRTPMSSSRMTWRRASAARRPLIGSACPDRRRGGGGVRSATLRTITRRSTAAAGVRPRSRSSARARAARSRVVRSGRRLGPVETPAYQRSSCAAARGAFQPLLRFVRGGSERDGWDDLCACLDATARPARGEARRAAIAYRQSGSGSLPQVSGRATPR